jgi:hypothetical protein
MILPLPIEKIGRRKRTTPSAGSFPQTMTSEDGFPKMGRSQEGGIHDGEDGCICADSESESENGDGGEAWRLAEHPQAESAVLK